MHLGPSPASRTRMVSVQRRNIVSGLPGFDIHRAFCPLGTYDGGGPVRLEEATKVPVDRLRLDRQNPRLIGEAEKESEAEIIRRLHRSAELDELLQSISANGYLDIEPLVVWARHGDEPGRPGRQPTTVSRQAAPRSEARSSTQDSDTQDRRRGTEHPRRGIRVPRSKSGRRTSLPRLQAHQRPGTLERLRQGQVRSRLVQLRKCKPHGDREVHRDRHDTIKRMVSAFSYCDRLKQRASSASRIAIAASSTSRTSIPPSDDRSSWRIWGLSPVGPNSTQPQTRCRRRSSAN